SPGTELATAASTSAVGVLERLRRDPVTVRKALNVLRNRGFRVFRAMAQERLTFGVPSGYSCAGTVLEADANLHGFVPGDRVACAGSGYANHAEGVAIPANLVVKIPNSVGVA